ncbi:malonic semialdehyde reductase [Promicromonospora thailandica]|uniref:3-hydroxypropanoate dehydrogenase n=1 Tax=Promicromonospora thailandica TaxID=765201 RepID=A0A9X2GAC2_9MICO|nr:malonic semialdehyde reductase [Promicromonospora thailandica]MCP2264831.1 3-hydroxypropanoate dehydrogenase [Promicromonospora thailandica]BFF18914.1 malonic semialdehyde reductase [Promicromonospora thailandica]
MTETLEATGLAIDDATADRLFRTARTVTTFADTEVTDEQLAAVYDLVKWGPTMMNTSPLRMLVVRDPEARRRLVERVPEGNQERVAKAPVTVVLAYDTDFHERLDVLVPHMPGARDMFAGDAGARAEDARTSAQIQAGYFIVGLRAAGLAAGPMHGNYGEIDAEFLGDTAWKSFLVINVSVAEGADTTRPRAPRLSFEDAARIV